ncbi:MAG: cob(I)yrinic acid a,c-diamide adenosyltransferase [Armatimonadota bacterium]
MTRATYEPSRDTPLKRGLVHLYTGHGKGKTSAAVGAIVRAVGRGLRCALIQFLKPPNSSGEHLALRRLSPPVLIRCFGLSPAPDGGRRWLRPKRPPPEAFSLAADALAALRECATSGCFDLVVGDELLDAAAFGLLAARELIAVVETKAPHTELILTGRRAPRGLTRVADLVTNMRKVKHPYDAGARAREGIEF